MADVFYDVANDGSKTYTTIVAAIAAVVVDEGTTTFTDQRIIRIFEVGFGDYTDQAIPPNTLKPTATNRLIFRGVLSGATLPRWAIGSTGTNLDISVDNFTIELIEFETDATSCIDVGKTADADGGIIKDCEIHGFDSGSASILLRIQGVAAGAGGRNNQVFNNIFNTSTRGDIVRIEGQDNKIFNNVCFDTNGFCDISKLAGKDEPDNNEIQFNSFLERSGAGSPCINVTTAIATGTVIRNNILKGGGFAVQCNPSLVTLDFNCVIGASTADFRDLVGATNYTFADWRTTFPTLSQNSINVDPDYTNETGGSEDLHILVTSPCIGAGVTVTGITLDFDGETRASPPAIGMDEFVIVGDVIYEVGPAKTYATVNAALAAVLVDEGTTDFVTGRIVRIFDDTYTEGGAPSVTLKPTAVNRLTIEGAVGNLPLFDIPVAVTAFAFGTGLEFVTLDNVEIDTAGTGIINSSNDSIIKNCIIHGDSRSFSGQLMQTAGSRHQIFSNKFSFSTSTTALFFILAADITFKNNIIFATDHGLVVDGVTADIRIYFNSFLGDSGSTGIGIELTVTAADMDFRNNIVSGYDTAIAVFSTGTNFDEDNNCVFNASTNAYFDNATSTGFATLALYNAALTPLGDNSIEADPLFISELATFEDLHILQGSPCRSAGVSITEVTLDFDGATRTSTPDMGMDELVTDADVLYTVGPGKTYATVNAALAAVLVDEGITPFTATRIVEIFDDTYTAGGAPSATLFPRDANPLIMRGAVGNFPLFDIASGNAFSLPTATAWIEVRNLEIDLAGTSTGISSLSANVIVKDCKIHGDLRSAGAVWIATAFSAILTVERCTLFNSTSAAPITFALTSEIDFINNQIFASDNGVVIGIVTNNIRIFFNSFLGDSAAGGTGIDLQVSVADIDFRNNIVSGYETAIAVFSTATNFDEDNNCVDDFTNAYTDNATTTDYASLAAYNAALTPLGDNSIEDDPLFLNTTSGSEDLHILEASPCADVGVFIATVLLDFDQEPRGTVPDIGMDEFTIGISAPFSIEVSGNEFFVEVEDNDLTIEVITS